MTIHAVSNIAILKPEWSGTIWQSVWQNVAKRTPPQRYKLLKVLFFDSVFTLSLQLHITTIGGAKSPYPKITQNLQTAALNRITQYLYNIA